MRDAGQGALMKGGQVMFDLEMFVVGESLLDEVRLEALQGA